MREIKQSLNKIKDDIEGKLGFSVGGEMAIGIYISVFLVWNLAGISFLSPSAWAPYVETGSTSAPQGSVWIDGSRVHWSDGSTEYQLYDTNTVDTSPGGSAGSAWVDNSNFHFIDGNGEEKAFGAPLFQMTYYWYDTQSYYYSNGHPTSSSALTEYFDESNSGVSFQGSGDYNSRIYWHNSQWDSKPSYLQGDGYSWKAEGYVYAPESGTYEFAVDSDDASDVWIDGEVVADYPGGHGLCECWSNSGSVSLDQGWHRFKARMEEGGGGDGIGVAWQKPSDSSWNVIGSSRFSSGTSSGTAGSFWLEDRYLRYIDESGDERALSSATGPDY